MKKVLLGIILALLLLTTYLYQARGLTKFDLEKGFKNISEEMSITLDESSHLFLYESQLMDNTYLVTIDMNPRNRLKSVIKLDKYYSNININPSDANMLVITNGDKEQEVLTLDISKLGQVQKLLKHKYIETENNSYRIAGVEDKFLFNHKYDKNSLYNGYFYNLDKDNSVLIDEQIYQPVAFIPINYLYYIR